jgi:hypothetical protein
MSRSARAWGDESASLARAFESVQGDNFKAYVFAVARRRLADQFRKRARTPAADFSLSSVVDLGTGPVTHAARQERGTLLREGLARIPLDDQIALELAYLEGLSTKTSLQCSRSGRTRYEVGCRARATSCARCSASPSGRAMGHRRSAASFRGRRSRRGSRRSCRSV